MFSLLHRKRSNHNSLSSASAEKNNAAVNLSDASDQPPIPKLAPAPNDVMNVRSSNSVPDDPAKKRHTASTIRTVRSFDAPSDISSTEPPSTRNSVFTSSIESNLSGSSYTSQPKGAPNPPTPSLKSSASNSALPRPRNISSQMSFNDATPRGKENGANVPDPSLSDDNAADQEGSAQWDGAVGKAALGKTGRVINKLVSDNEVLKRELKIERLKSEEWKQAAKLVEDKMDRTISDYESRLIEANVTKSLLSRKERQVEHLQSAVELEKKRTADAQEKERMWRQEMESARQEVKGQLDAAALIETRYNVISSHWKDQGAEVKRSMAKMDQRIKALIDERLKDDDKINVLRDLCDQQDVNIRDLKRQKDEISQLFEAYKREQEEALRAIKESARKREEEQLRKLEEAQQVLGELKWALNVKRNVKGAE